MKIRALNTIVKNQILDLCEGDLSSVTPGLKLQAYHRGRLTIDLNMGKTSPYYDLASMTKIIFTASLFMQLKDQKLFKLDQSVQKIWPEWKSIDTTGRQLLSHSAGLPWWNAFYKKLKGPLDPDLRWQQLETLLLKTELEKNRTQSLYSDLDLMLLGSLMTRLTNKSLYQNWQILSKSWGSHRLHFNLKNKPKYPRALYAPTEKCSWRGKILKGEVHDENTWALAGVAPHAGLFGRIEDVSQWGLLLRQSYLGKTKGLASTKTVRLFAKRSIPNSLGDWGLCFMLPSKGKASCGQYFSARSFGHTGFTGTSFWYDPKVDLMVVLLSNRVHPTRKNQSFVGLRGPIHDIIYQSII